MILRSRRRGKKRWPFSIAILGRGSILYGSIPSSARRFGLLYRSVTQARMPQRILSGGRTDAVSILRRYCLRNNATRTNAALSSKLEDSVRRAGSEKLGATVQCQVVRLGQRIITHGV